MLLRKQRTTEIFWFFCHYSEHEAYMELGENVYVCLCIIRPKHQAMEACARMAAYLQTFLSSALGKEESTCFSLDHLIRRKKLPLPSSCH